MTHGHYQQRRKSPTYSSWDSMRCRCLYSSSEAYLNYGAKGIKLCDRWLRFENFLADMGERPAGTTLDRIDNTKGYEPSNCRWVSRCVQQLNRPFKGVSRRASGKWYSTIKYRGKSRCLGTFSTEEEAKRAYDIEKNRLISQELLEKDRVLLRH